MIHFTSFYLFLLKGDRKYELKKDGQEGNSSTQERWGPKSRFWF
jgi:hypothetical protein